MFNGRDVYRLTIIFCWRSVSHGLRQKPPFVWTGDHGSQNQATTAMTMVRPPSIIGQKQSDKISNCKDWPPEECMGRTNDEEPEPSWPAGSVAHLENTGREQRRENAGDVERRPEEAKSHPHLA
jgi:hypothetical protein